jgi:hypothetical protein
MGSSNAPSKMAKRIKNFLGVFPPPRPAGEAPQAREIPPYGDHPKLRPRKNGPQHLTPKVPSEEGESQDPDYQADEEEEEHEDEDGDGNPATKRRRSPSVPSRSKHLRSKPTTRTISTNKHATSSISSLASHANAGRLRPKRQTAKMQLLTPFLSSRSKKLEGSAAQNSLDAISLHKCPQTVDAADLPCILPDFLNIHYYPGIKLFACFEHGILLPFNHLVLHLDRKHKFDFTHNKRATLKDMVDHLRLLTDDEPCTSLDDINLPNALGTPINISNEVESIRFRFQCPSCGIWIARNDSYRGGPEAEFFKHLVAIHHIEQHPTTIIGKWCQKLTLPQRANLKGPKYHIFELPDYIPAPVAVNSILAPSFSTRTFEAPLHSNWPKELKWPEHRALLGGIPSNTLQDLISPPTKQAMYLQTSLPKINLERGLLLLRKEITEYLRNAQVFVSSIHGSFRNSVRPM